MHMRSFKAGSQREIGDTGTAHSGYLTAYTKRELGPGLFRPISRDPATLRGILGIHGIGLELVAGLARGGLVDG